MRYRIITIALVVQLLGAQSNSLLQHDSLSAVQNKQTVLKYGMIVYSAASFYTEYKWWWEGNYHRFKFENDGFWNNYSNGIDKVGHFYTSYLYFNLTYSIMRWGDYDESTALWIAFFFPTFNALSIEIGDGFSTYAFSNSDLTANMLGIGYAYLQKKIPFLQNFSFKWSYYPSGIIPNDGNFRITDDYDGHIYWLSINVYNLLPTGLQNYYPRWLNVAVGYGGKNISGRPSWVGTPISSPGNAQRSWSVSFDYNLMELPLEGGLWEPFKTLVDQFKFPAPGIRKIGDRSAEYKLLLLN